MYRILKAGFLFFMIFLIGLILIFFTTNKIIDKDCLMLDKTEKLVSLTHPVIYSSPLKQL